MYLTQTLDQLINILEQRGFPAKTYLRPSLAKIEIDSVFSSLPIVPVTKITTLYQWHDGVDIECSGREILFFGDHNFLSLSDAVDDYYAIIENYSEPPSDLDITQCFPIAGSDASYQAIYCKDTAIDGLTHPIIEIFLDISIAFENLETMTYTVIDWFRKGVYNDDSVNNKLKMDIWRNMNSKIPHRETTL